MAPTSSFTGGVTASVFSSACKRTVSASSPTTATDSTFVKKRSKLTKADLKAKNARLK